MNLAENKFLVGFGVAMLLGVGGLGYYIFTGKARYNEVAEAYKSKADAYVALQTAPIYPDQENLEKVKAQGKQVEEVVKDIEAKLANLSIPLEEVSPDQFQNILRRSVDGVLSKAREKNVALPKDFYLGFNQYQNQPPKSTAAAPLLRQLRAIELVVHILLDHNISALSDLKRDALSEEGESRARQTPAAAPKRTPAAQAKATPTPAAPAGPKIAKLPFEIEFVGAQPSFRESLNAISGNQRQLFIVRSVSVTNEKTAPLTKGAPATAQPVQVAHEETTQATPAAFQYILGNEQLKVKMKIEQVVFETPTTK